MRDRGLVSVFYLWLLVFPAPLAKEAVFSPVHVFGALVKNQVALAVGVSFPGLLFHFGASTMLWYSLKLVLWYLQPCFYLFRIALGSLSFHMSFRILCSISVKNVIRVLVEIALAFDKVAIYFHNLNSADSCTWQESFYLLMASKISFFFVEVFKVFG
jgi:hypothetical protein